jgi:hypothetical protein
MYLNELADVVSDMFLVLPFAHLRGFSPFWIWNVVVLAVIAELASILGVVAGASRRYDGPMGKSDRALVFGASNRRHISGKGTPKAEIPFSSPYAKGRALPPLPSLLHRLGRHRARRFSLRSNPSRSHRPGDGRVPAIVGLTRRRWPHF